MLYGEGAVAPVAMFGQLDWEETVAEAEGIMEFGGGKCGSRLEGGNHGEPLAGSSGAFKGALKVGGHSFYFREKGG
jgi:hypothetical protein